MLWTPPTGTAASPLRRCVQSSTIAVAFMLLLGAAVYTLYEPYDGSKIGLLFKFPIPFGSSRRTWTKPKILARDPLHQAKEDTEGSSREFSTPREKFFLAMLCKSSPGNFQRRSSLRQLLGTQLQIMNRIAAKTRMAGDEDVEPPNPKANNTPTNTIPTVGRSGSIEYVDRFLFYFVMGRLALDAGVESDMKQESSKYSDLLLGEFVDSYERLTRKLIWMLTWLEEMVHFEFALVLDDDVFIDLNLLAQAIHDGPSVHLYAGGSSTSFRSRVIRVKKHRWYVPREVYPKDTYPPYHVGVGVVLSEDVLHACLPLIPNVTVFGVDDAYLGIVMEECGIKPTRIEGILKMASRCLDGSRPIMIGNMPADTLLKVTLSYAADPQYHYTC
eukprot:scpid62100/ scgid20880/ UDP-GlcNAc:betaGal beta-1,3-N-acetylglucosaminyltransferase 7